VATIEAFESGALDLKDFYFTGDDYSYKIETEAKGRFLQLLKDRFNSGARYKGKTWNWNTVIQLKIQELAHFLLGKTDSVDFKEPAPAFERNDSKDIRRRILELTQAEAQELGIGKSTLHYLRARARREASFKVYQNTRKRIIPE
jgi:hypothetical protein